MEAGAVSFEEMLDLTEEYSGMKLIRDGTATAKVVHENSQNKRT
jgi:hypothetical protein